MSIEAPLVVSKPCRGLFSPVGASEGPPRLAQKKKKKGKSAPSTETGPFSGLLLLSRASNTSRNSPYWSEIGESVLKGLPTRHGSAGEGRLASPRRSHSWHLGEASLAQSPGWVVYLYVVAAPPWADFLRLSFFCQSRPHLLPLNITHMSASAATTKAKAYSVASPTAPFEPTVIERRAVREDDVSIKIHYCGICHSDLHMAKNEWTTSAYPLVPGHEIVGLVDAVGSKVTKFKVGDRVGVGCFVSTCLTCDRCVAGRDSYCTKFVGTYSENDTVGGLGKTHGGYSESIVVQEPFVLSVPDNLDFAAAAPLLCAGITVYSPLVDAKAGPGQKIGIYGIGGLGHVAIKIARAMGAHVVAITGKEAKRAELLELGAHEVLVSNAESSEALKAAHDSLDTVIDTVSAGHPIMDLVNLLKFEGRYHVLGGCPTPLSFSSFPLLKKRIFITGSLIGGIKETQDMLDLCGKHNIVANIEKVPISQVNEAMARLEKGDVRYRFVLDIAGEFGASN